MSDVAIKTTPGGAYGLSTDGSSLLRIAPEPRSTLGSWVQSVASRGLSVASSLVPGGDPLGSQNLQELLNLQIQIQQQMQTFSMLSNIERSKHETEMTPIRNMRVG